MVGLAPGARASVVPIDIGQGVARRQAGDVRRAIRGVWVVHDPPRPGLNPLPPTSGVAAHAEDGRPVLIHVGVTSPEEVCGGPRVDQADIALLQRARGGSRGGRARVRLNIAVCGKAAAPLRESVRRQHGAVLMRKWLCRRVIIPGRRGPRLGE